MAEKDKKRKRAAEETERPSKKAAASSAPISVTLPALQDELHPIVVSSPGLSVPTTAFKTFTKPTETKSSKKKSTTSDIPAPATHSVLLHSSSHPRLDYTASQDSDTNLSHYIGIFDPSTNSVQVLPAHAVTLRTTLRSEAAEVREQNAAKTFAQQREDLGKEFGTKKAKKAIASKTENAITSGATRYQQGGKLDAVESAVMDSVKEASDALPARQDMQDTVLAAKPIPRPNVAAAAVEDVYPITVLVPAAEMRNLAVKEWQDAVAAGEDVKLNYRYIAHRLNAVVNSEDVPKLKALRYLMLLLDFNAALQPSRGAGKKLPIKDRMKTKMSDWPDTLIDSVRRRFAEGSELSKWHVDNLMTHIAAISLYIDNWRTDTFDLREDLRMENKQMSQYFHELGCKVAVPTEKEQVDLKIPNKVAAAQRRVAKLKLPLDFPKVRNPPRRK